jgi:hypothetical protein
LDQLEKKYKGYVPRDYNENVHDAIRRNRENPKEYND